MLRTISILMATALLVNANAQDKVERCSNAINAQLEVIKNTFGKSCAQVNREQGKLGMPNCGYDKKTDVASHLCLVDFAESMQGAKLEVNVSANLELNNSLVTNTTVNNASEVDEASGERFIFENSNSTVVTDTDGTKTTFGLSLKATFQLSPDYTIQCVSTLTAPQFAAHRDALIEAARREYCQ